jgi:hypothetical protein
VPGAAPAVAAGAGRARRWTRDPVAVASLAVVALVVAVAVGAPYLAPHDPYLQSLPDRRAAPGGRFPLGADEFGRDVLSRVMSALAPRTAPCPRAGSPRHAARPSPASGCRRRDQRDGRAARGICCSWPCDRRARAGSATQIAIGSGAAHPARAGARRASAARARVRGGAAQGAGALHGAPRRHAAPLVRSRRCSSPARPSSGGAELPRAAARRVVGQHGRLGETTWIAPPHRAGAGRAVRSPCSPSTCSATAPACLRPARGWQSPGPRGRAPVRRAQRRGATSTMADRP